ncbi:hypothetical protein AAC387_Pa05g1151 [Persea americana]
MLLISELEEQREIEGLKETAGTKERIEFLTFPSEWKDYEQTMEQTDTVVKNVSSDVIGSTSESLTEIQPTKLVEFEGGNIKKMSQQIQPSPTMEIKEIRQIIEEKERAISLIHQLNKKKEDYQHQLDRIIFELKTTKEENSNLQNERMELEKRVNNLTKQIDDVVSITEKVTSEKAKLQIENKELKSKLENSSLVVNPHNEQLKQLQQLSEQNSSRASHAEEELKTLKYKVVVTEASNFDLENKLKEATLLHVGT